MERNDAPESLGGIIPHLLIRDRRAAEAVEFYKSAFGARELRRVPTEEGRLMHCHLEINGGSMMLNDDFPEHRGRAGGEPEGVTLHLQLQDADPLWRAAIAAGATVVMALEDQFWGDRYGQLQDPFGHRWSIAAPTKAPA